MRFYENQLKLQVKLLKEIGKQSVASEADQDNYRSFYRSTVNQLKEYLRKHFKNVKAYKYWTDGDRVLTLFDGDHNKQIDIILGRKKGLSYEK